MEKTHLDKVRKEMDNAYTKFLDGLDSNQLSVYADYKSLEWKWERELKEVYS